MNVREDVVVCFTLFVCLLLLQCGTVSSVKPAGAGNKSFVLSAGGPVAPVYDMEIPLPYSVLRYRLGLEGNTDLHVGIHPTMALFGNLGVDAGITRHFARSLGLRPGFSAGFALYGFYDFGEVGHMRFYPELSVLFTYDILNSRHVLYGGAQSMIQFSEPYVVPAFMLGGEISLGRRYALTLETRWYAPFESGDDRVVDFTLTPFGRGALGFVLGFGYQL